MSAADYGGLYTDRLLSYEALSRLHDLEIIDEKNRLRPFADGRPGWKLSVRVDSVQEPSFKDSPRIEAWLGLGRGNDEYCSIGLVCQAVGVMAPNIFACEGCCLARFLEGGRFVFTGHHED